MQFFKIFINKLQRVWIWFKSYRIEFHSTFTWMIALLIWFSIIALVLGIAGFEFAQRKFFWFVYIWDHLILGLYSISQFQHFWWIIISGINILFVLIFVQPWKLHQEGGWRKKVYSLFFAFMVFFTLFAIFSWQFQVFIIQFDYFFISNKTVTALIWTGLIVVAFFLAHFLTFFSFGILMSNVHRTPSLNNKYIKQTYEIISEQDKPYEYIFKSTIYGMAVKQMAGSLFNILGGSIFYYFAKENDRALKIYIFSKNKFISLIDILSLARFIDKKFGNPYYVGHFEMVLQYMLDDEKENARNFLVKNIVYPSIEAYAKSGMFANIENSEEYGQNKRSF